MELSILPSVWPSPVVEAYPTSAAAPPAWRDTGVLTTIRILIDAFFCGIVKLIEINRRLLSTLILNSPPFKFVLKYIKNKKEVDVSKKRKLWGHSNLLIYLDRRKPENKQRCSCKKRLHQHTIDNELFMGWNQTHLKSMFNTEDYTCFKQPLLFLCLIPPHKQLFHISDKRLGTHWAFITENPNASFTSIIEFNSLIRNKHAYKKWSGD